MRGCVGRKLGAAAGPAANRGSEAEPNRFLRSACTLSESVRSVRTSLNSLVASLRRARRLSTTVWLWSTAWRLGPAREPALTLASSAMAAFRFCMSFFTELEISWISWAGSSNSEVRLASTASLDSFWLVAWMPWPMAAACLANADCEALGPVVNWTRGCMSYRSRGALPIQSAQNLRASDRHLCGPHAQHVAPKRDCSRLLVYLVEEASKKRPCSLLG